MPHDVIMPALGMAQETGKIVAWLKAKGDQVAAGDPIMEVETDKATMEVEAQVAGFLIDIRAKEGEDVPVGDVIAIIGDSKDETAAAPAAEPEQQPAPQSDSPAGTSVIMPALGMAQDTGKIVGWLKAPGDAVSEGDPLLEVETDKATMEVEAQTSGFLAETYAGDGDDVPVGEVIALITAEKPDAPKALSRGDAPSTAPAAQAEEPAAKPAEPAAPTRAVPRTGDRILASPKARRLAAERGIDLAQLVAQGVAQPFHVSDLDGVEAQPQTTAPASAVAAPMLQLTAETDASGIDALSDLTDDSAGLLAAFATAALRASTGADTVTITITAPGGDLRTVTDADRTGAAEPQAAAPALALKDMTGSRITRISRPATDIPTLTVTRGHAGLVLTLDIPAGQMGEETATAMLDTLIRRLDDPLCHLL